MRKDKQIYTSKQNKVHDICAIFIPVLVYLVFFIFLMARKSHADQIENTMPYGNINSVAPPVSDKPKAMPQDILNRVVDLNGVLGIDGSLRVLEQTYVKVFDLVETSTPVVAGTNHARIFLRADGAKQSLVIGWDDGTYTKIAGN